MRERRWPRRRYVIEVGRDLQITELVDLEAGAGWIRERVVELYEKAKSEGMRVS